MQFAQIFIVVIGMMLVLGIAFFALVCLRGAVNSSPCFCPAKAGERLSDDQYAAPVQCLVLCDCFVGRRGPWVV